MDVASSYLRKFLKLSRLLVVARYRRGLTLGVAAAIEHTEILNSAPFKTVIDVGANVGQFALAARQCLPDARIVSFEPLHEPAQRFRRLFAQDANVELHEVAIGPRQERATMHVSARIDSSSLLPIGPAQTKFFPGTGEVRTVRVAVEPLSNVFAGAALCEPTLLKIDVQGFELAALQGCESLLDRVASIYVECSFLQLYRGQALAGEVTNYLGAHGFALSGVFNGTFDSSGKVVQADLLYVRRSRASSSAGL